MDPEKNKRLLFDALGAMGMRASMTDDASDMMRRILCKPSGVSTKSSDVSVFSWDVWSQTERVKLSKTYTGDELEKELDERWQFVKRSLVSKDMMPLPPNIAKDNREEIHKQGWRLAFVDKDIQYYKHKDGKRKEGRFDTFARGNENAESVYAESVREQVLWAKQDRLLVCGQPPADNSSSDGPKDSRLVEQVDIATVRRRLANFLTTCPMLSDPHIAASKLAFAMLPPDETVITPHLSETHKRKAVEIWDSVVMNPRSQKVSHMEAVAAPAL